MIGKTIAHYEITGLLGKGGMGEVYRANDPRLGRDVALKVLPAEVASDPNRLARFQREARTLATLNHPHIVTIHSIEEADGQHFLTMELVEGDPLDRLVPAGGMELDRALDLSITLADALAAAHEKGIVHRDLKPSNVMVTREGRLKVLDFGLATAGNAGEGDAGMEGPEVTQALTLESPVSTPGKVMGTVPYMAPEQIRGEPVDSRADLFSFGILLYELLVGRRPFTGKTAVDVTTAILRDLPSPVLAARSDLPRDLERVVGRCLEKDCERRFQTAKDVRNELEMILRDSTAESTSAMATVAEVSAPPTPPSTPPVESTPSVAVLPFANRSRDEEDEYFSDGLADELLSVLAKIRGFRVAARTSSSSFKGKDVTIAEVGEALGVASILEGSIRRAGSRVRIAVQLVKVSDGYPLWSETYDRILDDIFAVQDDIAQSVVKELRSTLLGAAPDSKASGEAQAAVNEAARGRGTNAAAHRLYLQGNHFIARFNDQDMMKGIRHFEEALELDSNSAVIWVALARAHTRAAGWGWEEVHAGFRSAREAVVRALSLAPDLADAHGVLSSIQYLYDWDWKGAEASAKRALELSVGHGEALHQAGVIARELRKFDDAERYLKESIDRDPLNSATLGALGHLYRCMGRPEEAIVQYRKSLEIAPERAIMRHVVAILEADLGNYDKALAEIKREPEEWARLSATTFVCNAMGQKSESDQALSRLIQEHGHDCGIQIAANLSARGEKDEAFHWLEKSYEQRDPGISHVYSEPTLAPLHEDPRWEPFLKKLGFLE